MHSLPGPSPEDRIRLTGSVRRQLKREIRWRTAEYRFVLRRQIVLLASQDTGNAEISRSLSIALGTVRLWRHRFATLGLAGLHERPRSGRPPRISVQERHEVVSMACREPAEFGLERTHWSLSTLTETLLETGRVDDISATSVWTILNRADIKPHRLRVWLFSKDPLFDRKMRDIVRLYTVRAPRGEIVLSIDEKTSIQALERKHPVLLPIPGYSGKFEHEYVRHGTACLFACFNVGTGQVLGWCNPTRTQYDFLVFLDQVAEAYPRGPVHLVMDNLNTHVSAETREWNRRHRNRFRFHYTPTHASWLNQVEIWFSLLHRDRLKYGSFRDVPDLVFALYDYIHHWNRVRAHPFEWTWKGTPLRSGQRALEGHRRPRHSSSHEAQIIFPPNAQRRPAEHVLARGCAA